MASFTKTQCDLFTVRQWLTFLDHPVHRIHTYGLIPPSTENFSVPETSIVIAIVDLVAVSTKQSIKRVRIMEDLMINVRKYSVIY